MPPSLRRRADEELPSVRQTDFPAGEPLLKVLCRPACNGNIIADLQRVFEKPGMPQNVRRIAFEAPVDHFFIQIYKDMGVHPVDRGDDAFMRCRFRAVVFRGDGVVRQRRCSGQ